MGLAGRDAGITHRRAEVNTPGSGCVRANPWPMGVENQWIKSFLLVLWSDSAELEFKGLLGRWSYMVRFLFCFVF